MIQNALPGLREVRAPLAAGYTLALAVWLLGRGWASTHAVEFARVEELSDVLGGTATLAAASFAIYLVGTQLVNLSNAVFQIRTRPIESSSSVIRRTLSRARSLTRTDELLLLYSRIDRRTRALVDLVPDQDALRDLDQGARQVRFDVGELHDITVQVVSEAKGENLDPRVLVTAPAVHNEISRLRAEAELRSAVVIPGAFLALGLALDSDAAVWLDVAGLALVGAVLALLAVNAVRLRSTAQQIVMRLVADGTIGTPTLDGLQVLVPTAGD